MVFHSATLSSRTTLSLQQSLELANLYLGNAQKTKDPEVVLELCNVTESVLSRTKRATKKPLSPNMQDEDRALGDEIAVAFSNLAKLQESLGQSEKAQASYKKAAQRGHGHVQEQEQLPSSSITRSNARSDKGVSGSALDVSPTDQSGLSGDIAIIPSFIFPENMGPPTIVFTPPEKDERLHHTPQLACCLGLLRGSYAPDDILEPMTGNWLASIKDDTDERERLNTLATDVIRAFKGDELKDSKAVAEVVCLAPVLEKDDYRHLLKELYSGIDDSDLLEIHQLEGLAQLIQYADPGYLDADDLVKILGLLSSRLRDTHQQSSSHIRQLTLAVSHVLDAMADTKVKDLDRETLHEPLSLYLNKLKGSTDPYLVYQAAYSYQALQHVPDNETLWQATMRRTGKVIQGVSGLVGAVKGLDLNRFMEGLGNIQQGLGGAPEVMNLVKTTYSDVATLAQSGQGFLSCLKEGFSFERKQAWYTALRGADTLIREGQLAKFRRLICEAPCRRDPAFQWGVCQLLGEIAANPLWDADTRRSAVAFLGEIYQNDTVWGERETIKQWILNILMQLSFQTGSEAQTAEALLEELETDGDIKKQALYHACREEGPGLYPLKFSTRSPEISALLDRVQDKPDVEGSLRQLRRKRLHERDNAVYIPPQAKAGIQASDDTRFALMDKVKEFLESDQKVFLLLGDSGAGKSTFNKALEYDLWQKYSKKTGIIPLYINLPSIDKPEHDLIAKQLRRSEFTESQIRELKDYHKFVLICDGYDESQQTQNLYMSNRMNQDGEWNAKVVISCRSEYLGVDYRDRFQPLDRNRGTEPGLFQEAVITPFSEDQIQDYVKQYVAVHRPLWETEDYLRALDLIPSLKELVKNPFLMTLSLEVLPRMVDPRQSSLSDTHVTKVSLYDQFVEQWLERGKKRLGEKDLSPQARTAFESLSDEGFTLNGIDYLKKLSVSIYKEQGGQPVVEYSRFKDEGSWKATFFSREDETYLLREASPLTRNGNQYRFIHRSLLEYGLALAIFDPQEWNERRPSAPISTASRRGSTASIWSFENEDGLDDNTTANTVQVEQPPVNPASPLVWRYFVNEPSILEFLEERVQQEHVFKQQLLDYIECSKKNESRATSKIWRIAAANAITILVRAGVQFNGVDFQGIQIPGADISYGMFDSAQLQGADLRKTNLRGIWLRQANLSGARMTGAQFGELPLLAQESHVQSSAYSSDGETFSVGLLSGDVNVYSTSTWRRMWRLSGHTDSVVSIAYSSVGDKIVSGSLDGTVRLWNVETGVCCFVLKYHNQWIRSVAYSSQGDQFASASDDKTVRLWDPSTGECRFVLSGHTRLVSCVVYSPKGNHVASGGMDHTVRLWDAETGVCSHVLNGHCDWVKSIVFSPQGSLIVSAGADMAIRLWDAETGTCRHELKGHKSSIVSIACSPQGDQVVSGSHDKTLRLWDVETGVCQHTLVGHGKEINKVAFSPQGTLVASASNDTTVRLWDVETGVCRQTFTGHTSLVPSIAFSPTESQLASGGLDKTVRLWTIGAETSRYISGGHSEEVVKVIPVGNEVASCSWDTTIRLWDAETGTCHHILRGHRKTILSIDHSSQRKLVVSGSWDKTVRLWDTTTGGCLYILSGHGDQVNSVAFSPRGHLVASASDDHTARLWDVESGECHQVLTGHTKQVLSVVFSPQGNQIASSSGDNTIRLWDVETGTCLQTLIGHKEWVSRVVYSPRGEQIASASDDGTVRLWDVGTGVCLFTFAGSRPGVHAVAYSPKGTQVVSGHQDGSVRIWDVKSGENLHVLTNHSSIVKSVAYSPQGNVIASASNDEKVRLWDVKSGQCYAAIENFHTHVNDVNWDTVSGADYLITGCRDGSVRMWHVTIDEGVCRVCLLWSSSNNLLAVTDASIHNVQGLSQTNAQLLLQRGAVREPVPRMQEADQVAQQNSQEPGC